MPVPSGTGTALNVTSAQCIHPRARLIGFSQGRSFLLYLAPTFILSLAALLYAPSSVRRRRFSETAGGFLVSFILSG